MPSDDSDLETNYSVQDLLDIATIDEARVDQTATAEYTIHQYKNYVDASSCSLTWVGQTNYKPTWSTVYLQIYNRDSGLWETVDSDNTTEEDVDFTLNATIANLTNYKDGRNVISCRVYQLAA